MSLIQKIGPLFISVFLLLTACGKQNFDLGEKNPEAELKRCLSLSQRKHYDKAVECFEIFKSRFPQSAQGQEAELNIADTYYNQHEFLLAADTYLSFIKMFPAHPKRDYALYRAGLSYLKEAPKSVDRDQQYVIKAVEQFQIAIRTAPNSPYMEYIIRDLKAAQARLAKRIFYVGHFYYRTGEYISAALRFQELVETYPSSDLVPHALYYLTKVNLALHRTEEARSAVEMLIQSFPKDRWTNKAQELYLDEVQKGGVKKNG